MYDTFVSYAVIGLILFGAYKCVGEINKEDAQRESCVKEHNGEPFTIEKEIMVTKDGCKVVRISQFNEKCHGERSFYLSTCPGQQKWSCGKNCEEVNITTREE